MVYIFTETLTRLDKNQALLIFYLSYQWYACHRLKIRYSSYWIEFIVFGFKLGKKAIKIIKKGILSNSAVMNQIILFLFA
jgi:hypothetical protein